MNINYEREKNDSYTQQFLSMMPMGGMMMNSGGNAAGNNGGGNGNGGNATAKGDVVMRKDAMTRKQKRKYDLIKTALLVACLVAGALGCVHEILLANYPYESMRFSMGSAGNTILIITAYTILAVILLCILKMPKRRKVRSFAILWLFIMMLFIIIASIYCRVSWRFSTYSNPQDDVIQRYRASFRFMNRHLPNSKNIMKLIFCSGNDPMVMMERISQLVVTAVENSTTPSTTTVKP